MAPPKLPVPDNYPLVVDALSILHQYKDLAATYGTGIGRSYLTNIRAGRVKQPSAEKLDRLLRNVGYKLAIVPSVDNPSR